MNPGSDSRAGRDYANAIRSVISRCRTEENLEIVATFLESYFSKSSVQGAEDLDGVLVEIHGTLSPIFGERHTHDIVDMIKDEMEDVLLHHGDRAIGDDKAEGEAEGEKEGSTDGSAAGSDANGDAAGNGGE